MEHFETFLAALFVSVVVLNAIARWLSVPYPIPLVLGGLVLGLGPTLMTLSLAALCSSAIAYAALSGAGERPALTPAGSAAAVWLKDAKLNIEHNATDKDTGFQGSSTARVGVGSTCAGRAAGC